MNKTESIARRIFGWKLNRWDRWYDYEKGEFIPTAHFQPEENLEHAKLIVNRLEKFGFDYKETSDLEVSFNDNKGTGKSLAEAITNAAYSIIERHSVIDTNHLWQQYS